MHGLTTDGEISQFAKNNAGACFSPDGTWLFANIQSPGLTFGIAGPWMKGAL